MNAARFPVALDEDVFFDRDLHAYRDEGGRACMSVTQAITLSGLVDYSAVPAPVLRAAQERGRLVHHATAIIDRGDDLSEYEMALELEPYVEAYHLFLREMRFIPDLDWIERRMLVYLFGHRVGMTPDAVGTIAGIPTLLERKTTASAHPAWAIQTAGYELGLRAAGLQIRQRMAVQLLKTGYYRVHPHDDPGDYGTFGDCYRMAAWKLKHRLASLT